jgi:hypothetical protein
MHKFLGYLKRFLTPGYLLRLQGPNGKLIVHTVTFRQVLQHCTQQLDRVIVAGVAFNSIRVNFSQKFIIPGEGFFLRFRHHCRIAASEK